MIVLHTLIDAKTLEIKTTKLEHGIITADEIEYSDWIITAIAKAIEHVSGRIKALRENKIAGLIKGKGNKKSPGSLRGKT